MYIIVGRTALNYVTKSDWRTSDIDVITDDEEFSTLQLTGKVEVHKLPTKILNEFSKDDDDFADLDSLYTLKLSHAEYNIHWWKTAQDLMYMRKIGAKKKETLYKLLKEHWKTVHGDKSFLNLGRTSKEFFDDFVPKEFEHDWLHEVIAHPNPPLYTLCLKEGAEVEQDWKKFELLTFEDKVKMLQEEICVIATERWLTKGSVSCYLKAYQLALQKTVTNLTKGKTSLFILENLEHFLRFPLRSWEENLIKFNVLKKDEITMANFKWIDELRTKATGFEKDGNRENTDVKRYDQSILFEMLCGEYTYDCEAHDWLKEHGFEHVSQTGGGEGGSEYCETVFKLDGKYYKTSYSYYSYHGHDYDYFWDNMKEVQPKQKTVTVYE